MFFGFLLTTIVYANCTYNISSQVGFKTFYNVIKEVDEVCINISHFPFFIIFGEMPHDMQYYEYRSANSTKNLTFYRYGIGELLPYYYQIQIPYASITISSPVTGTVSFSYGTFPGICKTGTFFTNFRNIQFELSSELQLEKSLSSFDDKCVLFASRGIKYFDIDFDLLGNLLIYRSAFDFELFHGKNSISYTVNSSITPILARILIGNTTHSQRVSFFIKNDSSYPLNEFNIFYDPVNHTNSSCPSDEPCNFFLKIDWEIAGIIFIFIISSLIVIGALFYVLSLLYCPSFIQSTPLKTTELRTESAFSISPESIVSNKPEPKGYFAMDPILRPPTD